MADLFGSRNSGNRSVVAAHAPHAYSIPASIDIDLGLDWQFIGDCPVDLDVSCVALDATGKCVEAVFYNNLKSVGEYMEHSGDNQTGENGNTDDDETLRIRLGRVPPHVEVLMVCVTSYTGADFTIVESAHVKVTNANTGAVVGLFELGDVASHTGSLLCYFKRGDRDRKPDSGTEFRQTDAFDQDTPDELSAAASRSNKRRESKAGQQWWVLRELNMPVHAYTFCDVLPTIMDVLNVPECDREARTLALPDYNMEKKVDLSNIILSQLRLGLGWDGENDLDAALVVCDGDGQVVDVIDPKSGRLRSKTAGVAKHSGDKLNGYEVEGDDEFIDIHLMNVERRGHCIFFLTLLHSGAADAITDVPGAYCRVMNRSSPSEPPPGLEVDRIKITALDNPTGATALVAFCIVRRDDVNWGLRKIGLLMPGRSWVDVFPFIRNFSRLGARVEAWHVWRADVFPFAVRLSVVGVRGLGPLEPHRFACHAVGWVLSRPGKHERFKTSIVKDREAVQWDESHVFVVDRLDTLRILIYETATVGWVDIRIADYFGASGVAYERPLGVPAFVLPTPEDPTGTNGVGDANLIGAVVPQQPGDGSESHRVSATQEERNFTGAIVNGYLTVPATMPVAQSGATLPLAQVSSAALATNASAPHSVISPLPGSGVNHTSPDDGSRVGNLAAGKGAATPGPGSPTGDAPAMVASTTLQRQQSLVRQEEVPRPGAPRRVVPEGQLLLQRWFPLVGPEVEGEVYVVLERIPLTDTQLPVRSEPRAADGRCAAM